MLSPFRLEHKPSAAGEEDTMTTGACSPCIQAFTSCAMIRYQK